MARLTRSLANQRLESSEESCIERIRRLSGAAEKLVAILEEQHDRLWTWREERELFRAMIDEVPDYLFVKDRESKFVVANKAVAADLDLSPDALIGKTDFDLHPLELASRFFADEQNVVATGRPKLDIEEFVITPSAEKKWLSTSKVPMRNAAAEIIGIVGISRDVTERKRAQAQVQYMAHHDALTGLANRFLLMERLGQALSKAQREATSISVVFLDLDRLKGINDSLGHSAGDILLRVLAHRMLGCVRATDTVARLSGDEFVLLLEEKQLGDQSRSLSVVKRLQAAVSEPVSISGHLVGVSCSIGIATSPRDGTDPDALITNADLAMYRAKQRGRDTHDFFSQSTRDCP
jgi:diguanylate cyclase (GGDEF)-like protein/PAS domain S-box-containing protein